MNIYYMIYRCIPNFDIAKILKNICISKHILVKHFACFLIITNAKTQLCFAPSSHLETIGIRYEIGMTPDCYDAPSFLLSPQNPSTNIAPIQSYQLTWCSCMCGTMCIHAEVFICSGNVSWPEPSAVISPHHRLSQFAFNYCFL